MNANASFGVLFYLKGMRNVRKKKKVPEFYRYKFCRKCIWASRDGLCPFSGCPKVFGWVADKAEEGRNSE